MMINPPHPGESVQDCIDEAGITAKECAHSNWRYAEQHVQAPERTHRDLAQSGPGS